MLKLNGTSRWYYGEVNSSGEAATHAAGARSGVTRVACLKDPSVNRGDPEGTRGTGRWCPLATFSYKGNRSGERFFWESEGSIRVMIFAQQNAKGAKGPYFGVLAKW